MSYPPVPCKLVKKITDGEFVKISDLLPDRLASAGDDLAKPLKKESGHKDNRMGTVLRVVCLYHLSLCPRESARPAGLSGPYHRCLYGVPGRILGWL